MSKKGRETMRRGTLRTPSWSLAAFGLAVALAGCGSSEDPNSIGTPGSPSSTTDPNGSATSTTPDDQVKQILDERKTDYGEALRTASLKLRDQLPSLDEINAVANAGDVNAQKVAYEKAVDTFIASPQFAATMVKYFKDTYRTGNLPGVMPTAGQTDKDAASNFSAEVIVEDRPYMDILTASTNTCPGFDATTGTFTPASCAPGAVAGPTSGILGDPAILANYFSNMSFRRSRFFVETFDCTKFPIQFSNKPVPMGNGSYTGVGDFNAITGLKNNPKARIDFQDTSAVICANCHINNNFIAPHWANYDAKGILQATPQVIVPIPGNPIVKVPDDYQPPATFTLHWKDGMAPTTDIVGLGKEMATDPAVATCAVNRMWNYAMSRGDIVNDLATVPDVVTGQLATDFTNSGFKMKATIAAIFKSDDFTKF
jgi:hypothetical protein